MVRKMHIIICFDCEMCEKKSKKRNRKKLHNFMRMKSSLRSPILKWNSLVKCGILFRLAQPNTFYLLHTMDTYHK